MNNVGVCVCILAPFVMREVDECLCKFVCAFAVSPCCEEWHVYAVAASFMVR